MPDFLTVGGTPVPVAAEGATEHEPEIVGDAFVRAFAGNGRSTARTTKRGWTFTTPPLTHADAAAVRALVTPGVPVTLAGGFLDGPAGGASSVSCYVTVGESPYRANYTGGAGAAVSFQRVVTLTAREV